MNLVYLIAACLFAACTAPPTAQITPIDLSELPAPGTFTVTLSGDIEAAFTGDAQAVLSSIGRALYLEGERFSANLVLPVEQLIGTYPVIPLLSAFGSAQNVQSIGGILVDNAPPATDTSGAALQTVWYDSVVEGRVTLRSIDPMTGAFEYTVVDEAGRTVTVRAVFNELPQTTDAP